MLYCPKTGRSHISLLDFGIYRCPVCGNDLSNPENPGTGETFPSQPQIKTKPEITEKVTNNKTHGDPSEERKRALPVVSRVAYTVEYRDSEDQYITKTPWPHQFDLETERNGVTNPEQPAFVVHSVLSTSIPADKYRSLTDVEDMLQTGILANPSISVFTRTTRITIYSRAILDAISHVVSYYPGIDLGADELEIKEPFAMIAHYMEDLASFSSSLTTLVTDNSEHVFHQNPHGDIGLLLDFVQKSVYKGRLEGEETLHRRDPPQCTFRMLWLLFKPGSTVYLERDGALGAYVVHSVDIDPDILSIPTKHLAPYVVHLWSLDFDGEYVGRCMSSIKFTAFDGERDIRQLKAFPCQFLDDRDGGHTRKQLEMQGAKWYDLLRQGFINYNGKTMGSARRQLDGRVVVDSSVYFQNYPDKKPDVRDVDATGEGLALCPCEICQSLRFHPKPGYRWADYDFIDPAVHESLVLHDDDGKESGHRNMLCSSRLYGFALQSKTWEILDITRCSDPHWDSKLIETLVIPQARKTMIMALVDKRPDNVSHAAKSRTWAADWVRAKGGGLIMLLHGAPGTGKTFTAECIAEYTRRPLLTFTTADIGENEAQVEVQLLKWFGLAERWDAVMLIDEADMYLERRSVSDLKRNLLVAAFLRGMEYFQGILVLATNRIGTFDDALISRVHVVLYYPLLALAQRTKIWEQFFEKLENEKGGGMEISYGARRYVLESPEVQDMEWNGREIRNAFQTAVAMAEYEHKQIPEEERSSDVAELGKEHFKVVFGASKEFKKYLLALSGGRDDELADTMTRLRRDES